MEYLWISIRRRAIRRRSHPDHPACRRQVRRLLLQGFGWSARRRRLGGQCPFGVPATHYLQGRTASYPGVSAGRPAGTLGGNWYNRQTRYGHSLPPERGDLHEHRVPLRHPGEAPPRAVLPEFRRPHRTGRRAGRQARGLRVRGRPARVRALPEPQQDRSTRHDHLVPYPAGRHHGRARAAVERLLPGEHVLLHEQHSPEGRRYSPGGLPQRPDAHAQQLHRARVSEQGQDRHDRRRRARRADRDPVGEDAGPQVLLADQGQAGVLRDQGHRRIGGRREARGVPARESDARPRPSPRRSSMLPAPAKLHARRAR